MAFFTKKRKRDHTASTVDWSGLLPELIGLILHRLTAPSNDHDRLTCFSNDLLFASICSSWRSVAINNRCHGHLPQLPLLMLPGHDNTETRHFFSLSSGKNHEFHIPEIHRKWCCGSSEGWLVTVDGFTGEIQLFNPFSRGRIQLPSLFTFSNPQYSYDPQHPHDSKYIVKVVLSANPCRTADFLVLAITGNLSLAYCKPGADKWITIETQWGCFEDVIYYKGLFYAVTNPGHVITYDFNSEPPIAKEISGRRERRCDKYYLVESFGGLLLVLRHFMWLFDHDELDADFKKPQWRTCNFQVHKLDESRRQWIQMKSIGNHILFLGNSCSMSFPAQYLPQCKGNSIYFNDDYHFGSFEPPCGYPDIGVFNFENGSVELFCESPPIWTTPTFWIIFEKPL